MAEDPGKEETTQVFTQEVLSGGIVKMFIGPGRIEMEVYKKLLSDKSKFFKAAFAEGTFKEGKKGAMEMPEDDPVLISQVIDYLYRKEIPAYDRETLATFELYFVAEKYCLEGLMDDVIESIDNGQGLEREHMSSDAVRAVYTSTHENSKLRILAAGQIACIMQDSYLQEPRASYITLFRDIPEFACDVLNFQLKHGGRIPKTRPQTCRSTITIKDSDWYRCELHHHGSDEFCQGKTNSASCACADWAALRCELCYEDLLRRDEYLVESSAW